MLMLMLMTLVPGLALVWVCDGGDAGPSLRLPQTPPLLRHAAYCEL